MLEVGGLVEVSVFFVFLILLVHRSHVQRFESSETFLEDM